MNSRVLLVEDDAAVRDCMSEMLAEAGFNVIAMENADEATRILRAGCFDLLLTDVRMPGTRDGIDLAICARQMFSDLPIVVVTGFADQLTRRLASIAGRVRFVAKPFGVVDLIEAVRTALVSELASEAPSTSTCALQSL